MERRYRLVVSCPDKSGTVAAVTGLIAELGGNITEASQHTDGALGWFFMRYEIDADSLGMPPEAFAERFTPLAEAFSMRWAVHDSHRRKRVVIMASKGAHCLSDLLYRWRSREMEFDIPCVISNHDTLRDYVEWNELPFFHVPVDAADKTPHFNQVVDLIDRHRADVVVLARYMQVLPQETCDRYAGQIINIHHSFLPSFAGARPYHQAYERGVKLIGATCHYVTPDLDAGPIIEQDIARVSHSHAADDMVRLGKDVEKLVLARGLRLHLEDRVVIHGNKTVVFH